MVKKPIHQRHADDVVKLHIRKIGDWHKHAGNFLALVFFAEYAIALVNLGYVHGEKCKIDAFGEFSGG